MRIGSLVAAATLVFITLSGCASTGETNTTYSNYQGYRPEPSLNASTAGPGGVRLPY